MLYAQPRPDRLLEYQDSGEVPTTPFTLEELIARLKKMYLSLSSGSMVPVRSGGRVVGAGATWGPSSAPIVCVFSHSNLHSGLLSTTLLGTYRLNLIIIITGGWLVLLRSTLLNTFKAAATPSPLHPLPHAVKIDSPIPPPVAAGAVVSCPRVSGIV